ncbi:ATPase [Desulfamplus magnetovallimortis]|uniref:ATPase n=1 Tax=Desulfamplus magnetovallimortis TaxID=1246637 RepID=A0A1W1HHT3_9BACT|nr:ATP-binding protein [Desulfamplus magnetovallimortis]SLM32039.1 ATPase [Desulfamplus magnetovallimortis]
MKNHFVNRISELQYLKDEYDQNRSSLIILYGRRRIGKTTLIKEFIKNKQSLYFLATEESENENKKTFQHQLAEMTGNFLLQKAAILEWHDIFSLFNLHLPNQRKILVIDEFQYLGKGNKAFPSIFQKVWDELLINSNIMVILCGSLINMMVQQTLSYSSPLYGRRTGQIRLKQIPFSYYDQFFESPKKIDLIEYYAVTGGVPKYIELFRPLSDIFEAIKTNILAPQSFLYEEPFFLLEREVGEIGTYFSIIKSIAAGNHKIGKISANLGINQSGMTKYLKTLMELDLVERIVPVTEKNPEKSKKGLYRIKDNFITFWFKFVYPYRHFLEMDQRDFVVDKLKQNFRDNHVSFVYEEICREKLLDLSSKGEIDFKILKSGTWWNKNEEIDIVALSDDENKIIFGECKYTKQKTDVELFYWLKEKSQKVKWHADARKYYILFSKSGFSEALLQLAEQNTSLYLKIV